MNPLVKTLGLITGCASVSYLTLTAMMQDPDKPYRGHLNIINNKQEQNLQKNDIKILELRAEEMYKDYINSS